MKYGYIRVSTREQDETRQIEALKKVGVSIDNIFVDKSTGTTFVGRDSWFKLLATVVIGDTIVIKELDRLGRNNKEVKETFELVNKKGVFLEFLEQPLLNTYGKSEIERELLQPLILHLLGYFAEKENEKRKIRQKEAYAVLPRDEKGRIMSRKKNKPVGRENAFDNMTADQRKAIELLHTKVISLKECKDLTGYSATTIYKIRRMLFPNIPKRTGRKMSEYQRSIFEKWINKEIKISECSKITGFSKAYLYVLKKKYLKEKNQTL